MGRADGVRVHEVDERRRGDHWQAVDGDSRVERTSSQIKQFLFLFSPSPFSLPLLSLSSLSPLTDPTYAFSFMSHPRALRAEWIAASPLSHTADAAAPHV